MLQAEALIGAAAQEAATTPATPEGISQMDSIHQALKDSLANVSSLSDVGRVITGENPVLRDAMSSLLDLTLRFIPKLLGAILVLWIGFRLIKLLKRALTRLLDRRNAEPSLKTFLTSLVDILFKVMLVIMAMDIIGIKATSFIAILGAAGLAVGLALQGTLQNFASGVIILLLKPFKVGDYIETGNFKGYVKSIQIFNTFIRPFNGRIIVVPNSQLANSVIVNHTKEAHIRLEVTVSVAYGTNLSQAREVLMDLIKEDKQILADPAPSVAVSNLGDSSVDLTMWMWTAVEDYWTVWKRIRENVYNTLNENNIEIPFPQVQVHGIGDEQ